MKKMMPLIAFVASLGFALSAFAAKPEAKGKEETVTGTAKCAKCSLKEADKCQAVVVTKDGTKYFVAGPAAAPLHKEICKSDKDNVSLTGKVSEKDGKKVITAAK